VSVGALSGQTKAVEAELARLPALSSQKYVPAVYFALMHAALSRLEEAFDWHEKACKERSSYLIFIKLQPAIENLQSDSRYQTPLRKIGLN